MKLRPGLVMLVFTLPTLAFADFHRGDQTLTAELGPVVPLSNIDLTNVGGGTTKAGTVGFSGGGEYFYYSTPNLGMGADFNYLGTGKAQSTTLIPHTSSDTDLKSAVLLLLVRLNIIPTGNVVPYLIGGMGLHSTTLNLDSTPSPGFGWSNTGTTEQRNILHDTQVGLAIGLGGGLDYYMTDTLFVGFEARYLYLGDATYNTPPDQNFQTGLTGVKGSFSMVNLFARVGCKFGGGSAAPSHTPTPVTPQVNRMESTPTPPSPAADVPPAPAMAAPTNETVPAPATLAECPFQINPGQQVTIHLKTGKTKEGKLISCDSSIKIHSGIFSFTYSVDEVQSAEPVH